MSTATSRSWRGASIIPPHPHQAPTHGSPPPRQTPTQPGPSHTGSTRTRRAASCTVTSAASRSAAGRKPAASSAGAAASSNACCRAGSVCCDGSRSKMYRPGMRAAGQTPKVETSEGRRVSAAQPDSAATASADRPAAAMRRIHPPARRRDPARTPPRLARGSTAQPGRARLVDARPAHLTATHPTCGHIAAPSDPAPTHHPPASMRDGTTRPVSGGSTPRPAPHRASETGRFLRRARTRRQNAPNPGARLSTAQALRRPGQATICSSAVPAVAGLAQPSSSSSKARSPPASATPVACSVWKG